jgi:hypothetical protein
MIFRDQLTVRGIELALYYPRPRSAASAAADKCVHNRIAFRPPKAHQLIFSAAVAFVSLSLERR